MSNLNYKNNKILLDNLLNTLRDTYIFMLMNDIDDYDADVAIRIMKDNNLDDKDIKILLRQTIITKSNISFISQMQLNWSYNYPKLFGKRYKRGKIKNEYRDYINNYKNNFKIFDIYYSKNNIKNKDIGKYYISYPFYKNWEEVELLNKKHEWDEKLREVSKDILENNLLDHKKKLNDNLKKSKIKLKFINLVKKIIKK